MIEVKYIIHDLTSDKKTLYLSDSDETLSFIPVRHSINSKHFEYKGHFFSESGQEITIDPSIEEVLGCLGHKACFGRGEEVFLVSKRNPPGEECLACTIKDSSNAYHLIIHPDCKNIASFSSFTAFFGESTCLNAFFSDDRISRLYLLGKSNPDYTSIFDAAFNCLISAEIYQSPTSNTPLYRGIYNFVPNLYVNEKEHLATSVMLHHRQESCAITTDQDFLSQKRHQHKFGETTFSIPFYLSF